MSIGPAYRIDGRTVDRGVFYAAACDPHRSVVVEACAGAGKTWMLVSRILRALLDGTEPSQILAITFTRKAAGEMRERLSEWLAEFSEFRATHEQRVAALALRGVPAADAERLAPALGRLHEKVLACGRGVQVRTFHAWFAQLLRMAPLEVLVGMGLSPGLTPIENTDELAPEVMRRFQRQVAGSPRLHDAYWALVARHGRATLSRWLDAAWQRRSELQRADLAGVLDTSVPSAAAMFPSCRGLGHPLEQWKGAAVQALVAGLAAQLGLVNKANHQTAARRLGEALQAPTADEAFALAWKAVHTEEGTLRKLAGVPAEFAELSELLMSLDAQIRQHEAHEDHGRMVELSRALFEVYAALKRERGLVDMTDLEDAAQALLGDGEWAAWIQERLDARLRHLLIDEFQDTSPLQWHALRPWLESYAGAGGGASGREPLSLFIVGDPKQSIYRFRRAEPRVFAAAGEFIAEAMGGLRLSCDHTRRNAPEVLRALNTVFEAAQQAHQYNGYRTHTTEVSETSDDELTGVFALPREAKPPQRARADKDAPLRWRDSLTEPRIEEQQRRSTVEARHVATAISELVGRGQVKPGDIQVLARRRSVLGLLSDALRALHVPQVRPEDLQLADEPEARDLIALLDAIASPGHDLSLAQALKSPVFGATDDDLIWLASRARDYSATGWWTALQSTAAGGPATLQRAATMLRRWSDMANGLPPHDLLDRVLHEGDVVAKVLCSAPPDRRDHARSVIDAVVAQTLALDGGRYTTLYRFVRALKSGWLTGTVAGSDDAVKLLTVHGAKGLESEVVFLMDIDPEARNVESGSLLVDWPVESAYPRAVAFVGRWSRLAPSLIPLCESEQRESEREEMNGLYVAMTRARRRLVVSSIEPRRKASETAWWDRLSPLATPWVPQAAPPSELGMLKTLEVTAWPEPAWSEPAGSEPAHSRASPAAAADSQIGRAGLIGEAFHRLLQWSTGPAGGDALDPLARVDWLDRASAAAVAEFGLEPREADVARKAAESVLGSATCAPLLRGDGIVWHGNEVPVADEGQALRVDRLVAQREPDGSRTWWVLDYKLESAPQDVADNLAQLERYRRVVAGLQPGERVMAAFITGRGELIPWPPLQG